MILVDTSAWVEYDRASGSSVERRLTELITTAGPIAASEPVLVEVLAGARDPRRERQLRRLLTSFGWLPVDPVADFEGAASVYRACRRAGVTPRGLVDCLIVNVALRHDVELLAVDGDFTRIAGVLPLRLAPH
ncbi:MAG: PIN domain nuclease [Acidimicrobiales bacterium]|nr:PIN domain nuclease [Acidimicrobiales bacterium]